MLKLSELLNGYAVSIPTGNDPLISAISLDSRSISKGDLFCAVQGESSHGADFVPVAVQRGAVAILHDGRAALPTAARHLLVMELPELRAELGELAKRFYSADSRAVTAITGTNGKTSCCINYAQLSSALGQRCGTVGTLGWGLPTRLETTGLTTPDVFTLHDRLARMQAQGAKSFAVEASSHALAQGRLDGVNVQTAIFTNLTRDHLDYHATAENYGAAKASLFYHPGLRNVVLNSDDIFSKEIAAKARYTAELVRYSIDPKSAYTDSAASIDVWAENIQLTVAGITATVCTPWGHGELALAQIGRFNLSNALAVISALCLDGFPLDRILAAFAELEPVPGRMQVCTVPGSPSIVVDYAHTPDALEQVLSALQEHCQARLWLVFGCGGDRDRGKRAEMAAIAQRYAQHVIVTSDNPRTEDPGAIVADILSGMNPEVEQQCRVEAELDRGAAIAAAVTRASTEDWVVIAGKGHETYQQIGARREPFDDLLVAQSALRARESAAGMRP